MPTPEVFVPLIAISLVCELEFLRLIVFVIVLPGYQYPSAEILKSGSVLDFEQAAEESGQSTFISAAFTCGVRRKLNNKNKNKIFRNLFMDYAVSEVGNILVGLGAGVSVGVCSDVGAGVEVGCKLGDGDGSTDGVGVEVDVGVGEGKISKLGDGVSVGVNVGVDSGSPVGVIELVGLGDGSAVGVGV